jgi:hypothetical protein
MQPGGKVIGLAATSGHLYALCIIGSGVTTVLRRIGLGENGWTDIGNPESGYSLIQTIYATTGTTLFAGAMNNSGSDYGILYLDTNTAALKLIASNTEMLSGAASRYETSASDTVHYLCTRGKGVYKISENDLLAKNDALQIGDAENPDIKDRLFMGMIQLNTNGPIIVIERNEGTFFEVQADGFRRLMYSN